MRLVVLVNTLDWENIILGFKRTTREFLESILENTMESIIVTDLDGKAVAGRPVEVHHGVDHRHRSGRKNRLLQ